MQPRRVGVVGGGILGMMLAHRLTAAGHQVTLIEAASSPGGLAAADPIGEYTWDRFYHVILLSDTRLRALLDELGLADRLRWGQTRTGFYGGGHLHSLSSSLEYVTFPLLTLWKKARLAATILRASRLRDPIPLESVTAIDWLTRWSGRTVVDRIWRPLLRSKLGPNAEDASAAFIWAIIARMYAARRSGLKQEQFGYVDGGYAVILERFESLLRQDGVELLCGRRVRQIHDTEDGAEVTLEDGARHTFDLAVLTVPSGRVAQLCPGLAPAARERLGRVRYQGVVCPSLLLRKPLGGFYVTNLVDPGLPFTGVIEMTALVDRARFGGHTLIYLPWYLDQASEAWKLTDDEIVARSLAGLQRMYPSLTSADVVASRVARVREVLAISTLDYTRDTMPATRTSLPHVAIVNSAQIAQGTLNVNETIALAESRLPELAALLAEQRPVASRGAA
jgi:protoporphyrinogen oxidase